MANKFYPKGAEKILSAQVNFLTHTISAVLVPSSYTYSDSHEFLSDLGTVVGTAVDLTNKSITGGVLDADDPAFGALAPGNTAKALALFRSTGSAATSPLLCYLDEITGFPFSTNGGDVTVPWSNGSFKILSLV
ncbi:hypothetical protein [Alicycliphilus denitrificans]|uniref:hypothetical protein n=1 Tax=Alicycliphilus denitrificans TaxID=179636 RepID=UPI000C9FA14F|nr:hypothetical protein [Alicycliphilus denitrificans]